MKSIYSFGAALLLTLNAANSANAESFTAKVNSQTNLNTYQVLVDGKRMELNFSEPTDLPSGATIFFDGSKDGSRIQVTDPSSVGVLR